MNQLFPLSGQSIEASASAYIESEMYMDSEMINRTGSANTFWHR